MPLRLDLNELTIVYIPQKPVYVLCDRIESMVEVPNIGERVLVKTLEKDTLLVIDQWEITRDIEVKAKYQLTRSLLLPTFSIEQLPFVIHLARRSYELVNIITGVVSPLAHVSANNDIRQHGVFFASVGYGVVSLNFCSIRLDDKRMVEQYWHSFALKNDFFDLLRRYSMLPIAENNQLLS